MKILWFGRSALEKVLEKETRKRLKEEETRLNDKIVSALKEVIVFPGSKEEFEDFIGYKTEWVNIIGKRDKGLIYTHHENPFDYYNSVTQKYIVDLGVVALVNAQRSEDDTSHNYRYGMPVKRKEAQ